MKIVEGIALYQNSKNTYYTLWVFFFTISSAILGFIYGGKEPATFLESLGCTIAFVVIVGGNSKAIFTTQKIAKSIETELNAAINNENVIKKEKNESDINPVKIISKLEMSTLDSVRKHYWGSCLLITLGVWLPMLDSLVKNV